jgi:hypothetical protein
MSDCIASLSKWEKLKAVSTPSTGVAARERAGLSGPSVPRSGAAIGLSGAEDKRDILPLFFFRAIALAGLQRDLMSSASGQKIQRAQRQEKIGDQSRRPGVILGHSLAEEERDN